MRLQVRGRERERGRKRNGQNRKTAGKKNVCIFDILYSP
jgi:hypothetical protein